MQIKIHGNKQDGYSINIIQHGKVIASATESNKRRAYRHAYGMVWQLQHDTPIPQVGAIEWSRYTIKEN